VAKVIFREKLSNLGMRMPQGKAKTVLLVILALAVLTPSIYLLSKLPDFKSYYSLKHPSLLRMSLMITLLPLYYFAEEFFFRGFLFLGLWHRIGWHSFWITEIIFTLSHLHKPVIEILLCIPASVIFNCLSVYTRSFYPALMVHSSIGIFCLLVVNFSRITLF
jgi:membrane protease YdiL (CAAX protease family)